MSIQLVNMREGCGCCSGSVSSVSMVVAKSFGGGGGGEEAAAARLEGLDVADDRVAGVGLGFAVPTISGTQRGSLSEGCAERIPRKGALKQNQKMVKSYNLQEWAHATGASRRK